ncbi:hypothetical protein [Emcibacter sp.]|uniref:hypothetical protein n=1 Tax=Emcibacter sp. TaxID=1979954 RepID=UPI002AA611F5|nr:hypothetical protein [Emcibacter sp.]
MKKKFKIGLGAALVCVLYYYFVVLGHWAYFNFYYAKNGISNHGVLHAVTRSVFLGSGKVELEPIIRPLDRRGLCNLSEVKNFQPDDYGRCSVAGGGPACGYILPSIKCRKLYVRLDVWEYEDVRKKIIYASLHPCEFLVSKEVLDESFPNGQLHRPERVGEVDTSKLEKYESLSFRQKFDLRLRSGSREVSGKDSHYKAWESAGCKNHPIKWVYISVVTSLKDYREPLKVYKAVLRGRKIEGEYI